MELETIYHEEFLKEWNRAYDDWYGKFSLTANEPIRSYWDGYSELQFSEPLRDFWCHIWSGPHCIFCRKELIPGVTIVTGTNCSPMFFTPKDIVEKFKFTHRNPFTGHLEPKETTHHKRLTAIEETIRNNAA